MQLPNSGLGEVKNVLTDFTQTVSRHPHSVGAFTEMESDMHVFHCFAKVKVM